MEYPFPRLDPKHDALEFGTQQTEIWIEDGMRRYAVITTNAIAVSTSMIGPQTIRSGFDGVIQFRTVLTPVTASATQPVQNGQPSPGKPAADKIASP
jgi:hypothetical protein